MKKKIFSITYIAIGLIIGVSTLSVFADWTGPTCEPPNCNTPAPINVGPSHQTKLGSVSINTATSSPDPYGLDVFGISRFFGNVQIGTATLPATIKIVDGNVVAGTKKVLTDVNGTGEGTWQITTQPTSGNYQFTYVPGSSGYNYPYMCRISVNDGSATCKEQSGYGTSWGTMTAPFSSASSVGIYGLTCSYGSSGYNYPTCCRYNLTTGTAECKETRDVGSSWISIANPNPF